MKVVEVLQGRSERRSIQEKQHRGCGCDVDDVKRTRTKASVK